MASTSGAIDFNQLQNKEIEAWSRRAPDALADLHARGIHAAGGERMAKEQPALAQLYGQISELASPSFREDVRVRIRELRTQSPKLLEQLPMPVLFVTGDEDWVFPPAAGPALARIALKGSAVRVPAAGHSVYFERAAKFNDIIGRIV
jgi:pimeloyl-ACP methyl ester carboxylesterase